MNEAATAIITIAKRKLTPLVIRRIAIAIITPPTAIKTSLLPILSNDLPITGLNPSEPHISRLVRRPAKPIVYPFEMKKSGAKVEKEMIDALNHIQHNPASHNKMPTFARLENNVAFSCFP